MLNASGGVIRLGQTVLIVRCEPHLSRNWPETARRELERLLRRAVTRSGAESLTSSRPAVDPDTAEEATRQEPLQLVQFTARYAVALTAIEAAAQIRDEIEILDEGRDDSPGVVVRIAVGPNRWETKRLLREAGPGEILVSNEFRDLFDLGGSSLVAAKRKAGGFRLYGLREPPSDSSATRRFDLDTLLKVAGAATALAAWVAIVGGATMWARFHAAGVPEGEGVSVLPREVLIAQGLRTLLVPLVVGTIAAVGLFVAMRRTETVFPRAVQQKLLPQRLRAKAAFQPITSGSHLL
jgi:hypothetical protein